MNERTLSPVLRLFACFVLIFTALVLLAPLFGAGAAQNPPPTGPKIWLQESQSLPVNHAGPTDVVGPLMSGQAQPLAMASADVDEDGVADLLVGYSTPGGGTITVHRGNLDAFAPQSDAAFKAIAQSQFPSPFLPEVHVFGVHATPDFIAAGDFTGHGHKDLVVASRGGSALFLFLGDGKGNFAAGQTISLPGKVTSLAAGDFGKAAPLATLIVGVSSPTMNQFSLLVYGATQQGLSALGVYSLGAAVSNINFGDFGDTGPDAAFLSGGQVVLLHSSTMRLETLSLPVNAQGMALGWFVYDRNPGLQIALLDSNGSIAIAAHNEFDPRVRTVDEMHAIRQAVLSGQPSALIPRRFVAMHGWQIVENIPSASPFSGQPPVLFRTRVSGRGADDVMVLNPSLSQMAVLSHPDPVPGASTFVPAQVSTRPYSGSPVAAISTRVNVDGRPGILALHQGEMAPRVIMPIPDPTFFVNRTDDPAPTSPIANACNNTSFTDTSSSCSLREAVLKANGDTIMLQAGTTYTLTRAKVANDFSGQNGALYVNNSVTIVGGSQSTTIVQAGSTNATGVDMVMAVNEDINPITNASASLSNLTLENGHNHGTNGNDGDGGCMEFDTGSSGAATLTLTNVTLNNCSTTQGNGAGIAIFNFTNPGPGSVTFSNSIVRNNSVVDSVTTGTGGGIWVSEGAQMSMSNSQVINNLATQVNGGAAGSGGGITTSSNVSGSPQVTIHASTISGNQASGNGGGLNVETNLLIDQQSVISGNSAGSANLANQTSGGGLFIDTTVDVHGADSVTLQNVTITGNSAANGSGGGIFTGSNSGAGPLTIAFSRLAGNSAGTAGSSNLANDDTTVIAALTASQGTGQNWWGANTPANTIHNTNGGTTTFDPFIVLAHTASPNKIRINQTATLTGDMSKDNHGSSAVLAVLNGVPITFNNAVLGTIPEAQPETLNAGNQATATYNAGGVGGNGSADATVDQQTVTASITVLQPPSITKSFNPTTVATNTPSTITFSLTNGNTVTIDSSFTDTLPAGLMVATTPSVVNGCGGTVTATAGSGSISFANATLAVGTCSIQVNVQSAIDNVYSNSVTIDSTDAGNGNTSSANLAVINPPSIAKAFGAASITLNGTTSLTFTLSSSNVNLTLNGVAFTDNLPAGLVVATPSNLNNTCGGTATAAAGSGSVSLSGASLAPGASCTVSLNVTGTTPGVKNNSVQVSSTNGGSGNTSNASITVVSPPTITKSFGAASIPLNGSTGLSFTINNLNTAVTLTGVGFSDTLPAGLIISTPNGLTGACGGGTITATQATNVISLSGASLPASGSCTFSVNVTGTAAGLQNNTTSAVTSTEGGAGGTASASITVVAPPSIAKAFNPSTIALNATTQLTFTITNPAANTAALAGVAFTDTLPTGLTVANSSSSACGGTLTTTSPAGIALSGAAIAVNSQCQFTVIVTGAAAGNYANTTGNVTSTNGGTGNTASANLSVGTPPTITKAFGAASIPLNGATSLTLSISNPNTNFNLTGLAFTDNLPAGLIVATPNGLSNTCGGSVTAVPGSSSVSLSAGTVASSASCAVSVNVQGTTAGVKNNSVSVAATETGPGNTANASITVVGPPAISKVFGAASIPLGGSTSLSFTIQNPNASTTLTGIGFSDTLPAGLVVSTPNGLTGSCGGGTITATQATNLISLSGATLGAGASCTFSVNVTGTVAGLHSNTTGNVTSVEGGAGGPASASIVVVAPPVIAKAFSPATIAPNTVSALSFTVTNPAANTVALTGVAFTDNLPANITVATPNGLAGSCGGGTITAIAGSGSITLAGGTIPAAGSCTFSVNVTGSAPGSYTNTTGAVTSTNGGTGNTASATLSIAHAVLSITKTHQGEFHRGQQGAQYTLTVSNAANAGPTTGTVTVVDNLPVIADPHNLVPVSLSGNGWTCTLANLTCTRSDALAPGASYPPITFTVNIPENIASHFTNTATVSGGGDPDSHTASDPVTLEPTYKDYNDDKDNKR